MSKTKVKPRSRNPAASRRPERRRPLGNRRQAVAVGISVLAAAGLVAGAVWVADSPSDLERRTTALEALEGERDRAATEDLVDNASRTFDELLPVLEQLAVALPVQGKPDAQLADARQAQAWSGPIEDSLERLTPTDSAGTAVNVARQGLLEAVQLLRHSVLLYEAGADLTTVGRDRVLALAADARSSAVRVWAVAATQLDFLTESGGIGHVHLYLPVAGGEPPSSPGG